MRNGRNKEAVSFIFKSRYWCTCVCGRKLSKYLERQLCNILYNRYLSIFLFKSMHVFGLGLIEIIRVEYLICQLNWVSCIKSGLFK